MPDISVAVFAVAFGIEAIGLCDPSRLMVAADQVHAGRVAQFEADEEGDCFDGEESAIYVVAWTRERMLANLPWVQGEGRRVKEVPLPST